MWATSKNILQPLYFYTGNEIFLWGLKILILDYF